MKKEKDLPSLDELQNQLHTIETNAQFKKSQEPISEAFLIRI